MTWFQTLAAGGGLFKALALVGLLLFSTDAMQAIAGAYHQGPLGALSLAIAFVLAVPLCLGGVVGGFERGHWPGLVAGIAGFAFLAKAVLTLFAPSYLGLLPF